MQKIHFASKLPLLLLAVTICVKLFASPGEFENLGIPVRIAGVREFTTGPGPDGRRTMLYISYNQNGGPLFLMQVDPISGVARQYNAPRGDKEDSNAGAWACYGASDGKVYLGTCNGGNLLVFDPRNPDAGIRQIGKPAASESYIWQLTEGPDGKIYGCTYPQAKLVSYDPRTDKMDDLGRLDPKEMYARKICTGKAGWIYTAIGSVKAQIVAYNTKTGERRPLISEADRPEGFANVYYNAVDGHAYGSAGQRHYRLYGGNASIVDRKDIPHMMHQEDRPLEDGRWFISVDPDGEWVIKDPTTGEATAGHFEYKGDGTTIFSVGNGSDGKIYGSSILPLRLFVYDPLTKTSKDLGQAVDADGQIYSFCTIADNLYMAAYPGAMLGRYDPRRPYTPGYEQDSNPLKSAKRLGAGHLRPRAMIKGAGGMLYVGSFPPYGQLGGAMAVVDPISLKPVANYHNIIPDQSVCSLAFDEKSGLVFGGSSIGGGMGRKPEARVARFFVWNEQKKQKDADIEPWENETAITSLCVAKGRVFIIGDKTRSLAVYDIASMKIIHRGALPFGGVPLVSSLGLHSDGKLYGLAQDAVYSIDPDSFEIRVIARPPQTIRHGFALSDHGIYFSTGIHLWRYVWKR